MVVGPFLMMDTASLLAGVVMISAFCSDTVFCSASLLAEVVVISAFCSDTVFCSASLLAGVVLHMAFYLDILADGKSSWIFFWNGPYLIIESF